jgi:hypothetical protein
MREAPRRLAKAWLLWLLALAGLAAAAGTYLVLYLPTPPPPPPPVDEARIHTFCAGCHRFPPPDTFQRSDWKFEVEQAYGFFERFHPALDAPPLSDDVVKYFEDRAPAELPPADIVRAATPTPLRFTKEGPAGPDGKAEPFVSNVNLVHLYDDAHWDVLATDMQSGLVMALKPYDAAPAWKVLYRAASGERFNPAHAEVVDLDGDGRRDVLVANLGSFMPTDLNCGSVVLLRREKNGEFTPHTLLKDVGRVADVQAADFRGVGKKDLVVAAFGQHTTGEIDYLENHTTDPERPEFERRVLDGRHGTIHVPVCDLDHDGKPDFVALISQEHETVVAFMNEGGGKFRKETIYTAPHPAYGSSGIQLVDLNGDGELDVLYTNGDVLDKPYRLKPYHSIQWLENPGRGQPKFPWEHHPIAPMYGVHRAVAADFRGKGVMDVVAVCFLPEDGFPDRKAKQIDAVIYLEQTAPGKFERHTLEAGTCDHVTCVAGDLYGSGRPDLVVGNFVHEPGARPVTIWRNDGLAAALNGAGAGRLTGLSARKDWPPPPDALRPLLSSPLAFESSPPGPYAPPSGRGGPRAPASPCRCPYSPCP